MRTIVNMYSDNVFTSLNLGKNVWRKKNIIETENKTTNSFAFSSLQYLRSLKLLTIPQSMTIINAGINKNGFIKINSAAMKNNLSAKGATLSASKKPVFMDVNCFVIKKISHAKMK